MRAWRLVAVLLLMGCASEPKLRADNEANFQRSYERIARSVNSQRMAALDAALLAILLARARGHDIDRTEGFSGAADIAPPIRRFTPLIENWPHARAALVVDQCGPLVNDRSIDDILALAARQEAQVMGSLQDWSTRLRAPLDDAWKIERTSEPASLRGADRTALTRVRVSGERDMALSGGESPRRVIAFLIENGLDAAIRAVVLSTRDPAKGGAASAASFEYVFPASLPPGARQRIISRDALAAPGNKAHGRLKLYVAGVQDQMGNIVGLGPRAAPPEPPPWDPFSSKPMY